RHDRSQVDGAAVGEDDVGLPVTRVVERVGHGQSLGSSGSRPYSGKTARRVSRTATSTGSSSPSPHGLNAVSCSSVIARGISAVGAAFRTVSVQPGGIGVPSGTSRSSTVAIRCVHDRGTTRISWYPPPPTAIHLPFA